jgi:hypothetical protein
MLQHQVELKLFIQGNLENMSRDILALDRKQWRLVIGLLTGHCTLRWHLHIMGLPDNECYMQEM